MTGLHSKFPSSLERPCLKITTNQIRKSWGRVTGLHSQTVHGCKPAVLSPPYGMVFWVPALASELMLLWFSPLPWWLERAAYCPVHSCPPWMEPCHQRRFCIWSHKAQRHPNTKWHLNTPHDLLIAPLPSSLDQQRDPAALRTMGNVCWGFQHCGNPAACGFLP